MQISPLTFSTASYGKSDRPAFRALTPVTYVQVDDLVYTRGEVLINVIKAFVKRIKQGRKEDAALRSALKDITGDFLQIPGYQSVTRIGNNIVTGPDAANLEAIWSTNLPLAQKKDQASNFVKSLFYQRPMKNMAITAKSVTKKGKVQYEIENVYPTRYY